MKLEKIMDLVAEPDENGCMLWRGRVDKDGYPRGELGPKTLGIHRLIYEIHRGAIPEHMTVDHICFTRACVNIQHLRLLTPTMNNMLKRSTMRGTCKHGHPRTKENATYKFKQGGWLCLVCNRERCRQYYAKRKAAA